MKRYPHIVAIFMVLCATLTSVRADETRPAPVVVELFTSQGCSACPPADAFMAELSARADVIALSLPVDYWDFLGWKDTLASPAHTDRQKAYLSTLNLRSVRTPQMVVDGATQAIGSHEQAVKDLITQAHQTRESNPGLTPTLQVENREDTINLTISDPAPTRPATSATIWLVHYSTKVPVKIERGKNRGKTINYINVVREMKPLGTWSGGTTTLDIAKTGLRSVSYDGCAVLLQSDAQGPILAATRLDMAEPVPAP